MKKNETKQLDFILLTGLLVLLLVYFVSCESKTGEVISEPEVTLQISSDSILHIDSSYYHMSDWVGKKPVVLIFGGTWCGPCRSEVPTLKQLYAEYQPQGIEFISLWVNDTQGKVISFVADSGITWVNLIDNHQVMTSSLEVTVVPTLFFVNKEGILTKRFNGTASYERLKAECDNIL